MTRDLLLCTSLQIAFAFEKYECQAIFTFMNEYSDVHIFGEKNYDHSEYFSTFFAFLIKFKRSIDAFSK